MEKQRGITLLTALIIVAIALSLSLGIVSIVAQQIDLGSSVDDASASYYAAESGVECAYFFLENNEDNFPFPKKFDVPKPTSWILNNHATISGEKCGGTEAGTSPDFPFSAPPVVVANCTKSISNGDETRTCEYTFDFEVQPCATVDLCSEVTVTVKTNRIDVDSDLLPDESGDGKWVEIAVDARYNSTQRGSDPKLLHQTILEYAYGTHPDEGGAFERFERK